MEEAAKTAKQSAESVSKGSEKLGRTAAFRALSQVGRAGAHTLACSESGARVLSGELSPGEAALPPPPRSTRTKLCSLLGGLEQVAGPSHCRLMHGEPPSH